jgi:ABC-type antimicrobial peptide transport system permease subunit
MASGNWRMDGAAVDIVADVKYALRRLKQSLGFAATVVVMLALGIGATTAVFTLIQQVMLRSLAVARPQQLWRIGDAVTCCYSTGYTQGDHAALNDWTLFSWEAYQRFHADTPAFEELAAWFPPQIFSGRLIASHLFGVRPWDPALLLGATLLLVAATLLAAIIPARRAAGVDPMQTLRSE